jgi:predicted transcriptional regulator
MTPKQLRKAREVLNITIRELARVSGVSANSIWRIEVGETDPKASTLAKLQDALEANGAVFGPKDQVKTK